MWQFNTLPSYYWNECVIQKKYGNVYRKLSKYLFYIIIDNLPFLSSNNIVSFILFDIL